MALPLLVAGAGLSAFYNVGRSLDNVKYWHDYGRNTGYRVKYPFRRGRYQHIGYMSNAFGGFGGFGLSSDPVPAYGFANYNYRSDPMYL